MKCMECLNKVEMYERKCLMLFEYDLYDVFMCFFFSSECCVQCS